MAEDITWAVALAPPVSWGSPRRGKSPKSNSYGRKKEQEEEERVLSRTPHLIDSPGALGLKGNFPLRPILLDGGIPRRPILLAANIPRLPILLEQ